MCGGGGGGGGGDRGQGVDRGGYRISERWGGGGGVRVTVKY